MAAHPPPPLGQRFSWRLMLALGAVAWLVFLHGLTRDPYPIFDETHYVPAARALIALAGPRNIEHPLFGKEVIALGMLIFGDNALGWRFMATLGGGATIMALFAIGWQIFGRTRPALVAALLALVNFTVFVQARIGMIDTPMAALVLAGIAATLAAARSPARAGRWLLAAGLCFGLGVGAKWIALPYLALAGTAIAVVRLRDHGWHWRAALGDGEQPHFGRIATVPAMAIMGGASAIAYAATFAPAFFYADDAMTLAGLLPFQAMMYAQQTLPLAPHPYQSDWWSWPFDIRPIWYLYEAVDGVQRGVLMIGNPVVMLGGLAALGYCLVAGMRARSWPLLAPVILWLAGYAPWIVIPKKIGFFYYYYLPSILICLAIAAAADAIDRRRRWGVSVWAVVVAAALFGCFYPILSAAALPGPQSFNRWMWFDTWR